MGERIAEHKVHRRRGLPRLRAAALRHQTTQAPHFELRVKRADKASLSAK
jgi:hypothetical protein